MRYESIEQRLRGKRGENDGGFDRAVLTNSFAAVIDGATTKEPEGTPDSLDGAAVADAIASSLLRTHPRATAQSWVAEANRAIHRERVARTPAGGPFPDFEALAAATVCVYSAERHEIWRLGDVTYAVDGVEWPPTAPIDRTLGPVRALVLEAHLASGESLAALQANDPGRRFILPALRLAGRFRNRSGSLFGFGALDGESDPLPFLEVQELDSLGPHDLVLATDGYVGGIATLEQAESRLRSRLLADPLMVAEDCETKGLKRDAESFDDRAYIRIKVYPNDL